MPIKFQRLTHILIWSFFVIVLFVLMNRLFSPFGERKITTDFSEVRSGVSRLEPSQNHSGFLRNLEKNFNFHIMTASPLSFIVRSVWTWHEASIELRYFSPADNVNVLLGHTEHYPKISIDRTFVAEAGLLSNFNWPVLEDQGLFLYQRKRSVASLHQWLSSYKGDRGTATLNLSPNDVNDFPILASFLDDRERSVPYPLKGTHTFFVASLNGQLTLDTNIQRIGETWPIIAVRAEKGGDVLYYGAIGGEPGEKKITHIRLRDLPINIPLKVEVILDPEDILESFATQSPYIILQHKAFLNAPESEDAVTLYSINSRGISARVENKDMFQTIRINNRALEIDRENYTFIEGKLPLDIIDISLPKPQVEVGSEYLLAFSREEILRYQFLHLPGVEELSSLDGIDEIISVGEYDDPKEGGGIRVADQNFATFGDFYKSDSAAFTIHAFYPGSTNTVNIQILRGTIHLRKRSWISGEFIPRAAAFWDYNHGILYP